MRIFVKGVLLILAIFCPVFELTAQDRAASTRMRVESEGLPALLRPSDYAFQRAKDMGGEVFKLLPYEFRDPTGVNHYYYHYQGNYSLATRSHGQPDQIGLVHGELRVGYGFFVDLGERDFRATDKSAPEARYFLSYKPPQIDSDIRKEYDRLRDTTHDGLRLRRRIPPIAGHTYLLRSINYDVGDLAIVFHVLEVSPDSSVTIIWKKLAEFEMPKRLPVPDSEMRRTL